MTATAATKKAVVPVRKVDKYDVSVMALQGLSKRQVGTVLEAAGVESLQASRFRCLWEVAKPKNLSTYGEGDNEARGIIAHALFLRPDCQGTHGEVRYLFDRAGRYMRNRIEVGDCVSECVFQVWHVLRFMMLDWQRRQRAGEAQ